MEQQQQEMQLIPNQTIISSEVTGSRYIPTDFLGRGTFGQVYRCQQLLPDGSCNEVALKVSKSTNQNFQQHGEIEAKYVSLLSELSNFQRQPRIIKFIEWFYHNNHVFIALELCKCNLFEYCQSNWTRFSSGRRRIAALPIKLASKWTRQIVQALQICKSMNMIHGDLKPENVMIQENQTLQGILPELTYELRVIDFSNPLIQGQEDVYKCDHLQSRYYRSAEVILGIKPFTCGIDMWSLATMTAELLFGSPLFPGASEYDMIRLFRVRLGEIPDHILAKGQKTELFYHDNGTNFFGNRFEFRSLESHIQVWQQWCLDPNRRGLLEYTEEIPQVQNYNYFQRGRVQIINNNQIVQDEELNLEQLVWEYYPELFMEYKNYLKNKEDQLYNLDPEMIVTQDGQQYFNPEIVKMLKSCLDFITQCLDYNHPTRMTPEQAMEHQFIIDNMTDSEKWLAKTTPQVDTQTLEQFKAHIYNVRSHAQQQQLFVQQFNSLNQLNLNLQNNDKDCLSSNNQALPLSQQYFSLPQAQLHQYSNVIQGQGINNSIQVDQANSQPSSNILQYLNNKQQQQQQQEQGSNLQYNLDSTLFQTGKMIQNNDLISQQQDFKFSNNTTQYGQSILHSTGPQSNITSDSLNQNRELYVNKPDIQSFPIISGSYNHDYNSFEGNIHSMMQEGSTNKFYKSQEYTNSRELTWMNKNLNNNMIMIANGQQQQQQQQQQSNQNYLIQQPSQDSSDILFQQIPQNSNSSLYSKQASFLTNSKANNSSHGEELYPFFAQTLNERLLQKKMQRDNSLQNQLQKQQDFQSRSFHEAGQIGQTQHEWRLRGNQQQFQYEQPTPKQNFSQKQSKNDQCLLSSSFPKNNVSLSQMHKYKQNEQSALGKHNNDSIFQCDNNDAIKLRKLFEKIQSQQQDNQNIVYSQPQQAKLLQVHQQIKQQQQQSIQQQQVAKEQLFKQYLQQQQQQFQSQNPQISLAQKSQLDSVVLKQLIQQQQQQLSSQQQIPTQMQLQFQAIITQPQDTIRAQMMNCNSQQL